MLDSFIDDQLTKFDLLIKNRNRDVLDPSIIFDQYTDADLVVDYDDHYIIDFLINDDEVVSIDTPFLFDQDQSALQMKPMYVTPLELPEVGPGEQYIPGKNKPKKSTWGTLQPDWTVEFWEQFVGKEEDGISPEYWDKVLLPYLKALPELLYNMTYTYHSAMRLNNSEKAWERARREAELELHYCLLKFFDPETKPFDPVQGPKLIHTICQRSIWKMARDLWSPFDGERRPQEPKPHWKRYKDDPVKYQAAMQSYRERLLKWEERNLLRTKTIGSTQQPAYDFDGEEDYQKDRLDFAAQGFNSHNMTREMVDAMTGENYSHFEGEPHDVMYVGIPWAYVQHLLLVHTVAQLLDDDHEYLSQKQRAEILTLSYYEELKDREIEARLGIKGIKDIRNNALKHMRTHFERDPELVKEIVFFCQLGKGDKRTYPHYLLDFADECQEVMKENKIKRQQWRIDHTFKDQLAEYNTSQDLPMPGMERLLELKELHKGK